MPRASRILREKVVDEEGNILELVIWSVPATAQNSSGVRYRHPAYSMTTIRRRVIIGTWKGLRRCMPLPTSTDCWPISSPM